MSILGVEDQTPRKIYTTSDRVPCSKRRTILEWEVPFLPEGAVLTIISKALWSRSFRWSNVGTPVVGKSKDDRCKSLPIIWYISLDSCVPNPMLIELFVSK